MGPSIQTAIFLRLIWGASFHDIRRQATGNRQSATEPVDSGLAAFTSGELFVSPKRSRWPVRHPPLCGKTEENPCFDFLELMQRFCHFVANERPTNGSASLNLRLLPGVHSVWIPSEPNFYTIIEGDSTSQTPAWHILSTCDFSNCTARFNISGNSTKTTTILLTSMNNTSSSCGNNSSQEQRSRKSPQYDDLTNPFYLGGRNFLFFGENASVSFSHLTFRTELSTTQIKVERVFLLEQLHFFEIEKCRFIIRNKGLGVLAIVPPKKPRHSRTMHKIVNCEFVIDLPSNKSFVRSSRPVITIVRYTTHFPPSPKLFLVNISSCSFRLLCDEDDRESHGSTRSTYSDRLQNGYLPRGEDWLKAFAIAADLNGMNAHIAVQHCSFNSSSPSGESCYFPNSAVFIGLGNGTATIDSCSFTNLASKRGSAIQVLGKGRNRTSSINSIYGKFLLKNTVFQNNGRSGATMFGGALSICLADRDEHGHITMNIIFLYNITFNNCFATFGAAVFLSSYQDYAPYFKKSTPERRRIARISMKYILAQGRVTFKNITVLHSSAQLQGGIFVQQTGITINDGHIRGVEGSGIYLRNSFLRLKGKVEFVENQAPAGGAICVSARSRITFNAALQRANFSFHGNQALLRGGAIYIDKSSASVSDGDPFTDAISPDRISVRSLENGCPLRFKENGSGSGKTIHFSKNKAVVQGDDMYIYSFRLCPDLMKEVGPLYRRYAENRNNSQKPLLASTSTKYLLFDGADTFCLKRLGNFTFLLKSCKLSSIRRVYKDAGLAAIGFVLENRIRERLQHAMETHYTGIVSSYDLLKPWNSSIIPVWRTEITQDSVLHGFQGNTATARGLPLDLESLASYLASLTLLPSPGEEFSLNITCLDEILNEVEASVSVQVIPSSKGESTNHNLCVHNECGPDAVTFGTNRQFSGLSIIGPVGSRGWLRVSLNSDSQGNLLLLDIPFELFPCSLGFSPPENNSESQQCQCQRNAAVSQCIEGKKIVVERGMWIGSLSKEEEPDSNIPFQSNCKKITLSSEIIKTSDDGPIVTSLGLINRRLVYGECVAGYCHSADIENISGIIIDTSHLRFTAILQDTQAQSVTRCAAHRSGLLCGSCEQGYSVTLYSKACVRCNGKNYIGVFITTFVVGLALFVGSLYWNWTPEMMTSFSSFYFFGQALTFVTSYHHGIPHLHTYISRSLNLDWSFGMCLTDDLNALTRLAWSYLAPVYLLSLVLLSLFLSRFYRLNRIFGRSTCIKMFWQFILLSFSSLASTSFQLFKCVYLSPMEVFSAHKISNWRFADDASFECFAGDHCSWAIVATTIVGVFCVPLPLFLPFLDRYHRLKPFYDVYSSVFKDNRRWWCSVDLLRRLLLAAVYTAENIPAKTHLAMCLITTVLAFVHCAFWPFKSWKANMIEALFLLALSLITTLSGPKVTFARAIAIEVIFFTTIAVLFIDIAHSRCSTYRKKKHRTQTAPYGISGKDEEDDGTMLRERLLADVDLHLHA